ncbi:hypothetical protein L249_1427 [Ophiocordyceps polyrhachis-furcata BCC 54312]|uniref:Uncharacterized protein n=1 Tax=Ophiocordyceps polyrhachis-furcata BCC 54312 TaxID=1330021 RepID=A0A367L482_9HYPO|nr:hypothetical protein L249_1427 [Ophiocordyceps polyrhachis-furcata BCC 54312]
MWLAVVSISSYWTGQSGSLLLYLLGIHTYIQLGVRAPLLFPWGTGGEKLGQNENIKLKHHQSGLFRRPLCDSWPQVRPHTRRCSRGWAFQGIWCYDAKSPSSGQSEVMMIMYNVSILFVSLLSSPVHSAASHSLGLRYTPSRSL